MSSLRSRLRGGMWGLSTFVAAVAATVSYTHIYTLARTHGGTELDSALLPLSVDALILVGELMLLHESDDKAKRFIFGWVLVVSGILATLTANASFGWQYGLFGAVLWGWPAYSFILAAAGMVTIVKRNKLNEDQSDSPVAFGQTPANAYAAAEQGLIATLAAGNPYSQRQLADLFNISRADAKAIHAKVLTAANGHIEDEQDEVAA